MENDLKDFTDKQEAKQPCQNFVVRTNQVHENQFGKGMWCKLPENGRTTVKIYLR
ncbi:MAG: hypothetical protein J6M65_03100 [Eubacterium sp.]|nr:hypothetical protein [Eubacterium sp.]